MEEKQAPRIPNGIIPPEVAAQSVPPQGAPQGFPPSGMPQGGPPQGFPPNGMPPQGMPPRGRGPRGVPPHGMGPNGPKQEVFLGVEEREEMLAIMPDFKRWQSVFLTLYIAVVFVSIVVKLIIYAYLHFYVKSPDSGVPYFVSSVLVPLIINILIFVIGKGMMNRMHEMDMRKNFIPVFMMQLLNYVMCLVPRHIFFVMMIGFTVPICMTTIFSHKKMCSLMTRISQIGIILASAKQIIFTMNNQSAGYLPAEQSDAYWLIPQALIIFAITTIVGIVAQSTLGMTEGQRQKLLDYTRSIKEAQKRAEAANMAKSAFLANMSHEIRTPINAILGMNEMILRENTNKQIEGYALNIQSAGNSLLYQVNDVLDISKIESGKLEIVEAEYDTASLIHDCHSMITDKAKQKGLLFSVECSENIPSKMFGDEVRLRQIIVNLLTNAYKYTNKGSITFAIDGTKSDDNNFNLVISVKDTGIGIKEENLAKLFEQFTRFDLEKNRAIEGTGLGLAITKRLIDLMNGKIEVQSIYGMGSLFTVKVSQKIVDATPIGDYNKRYAEAVAKNAKQKHGFRAPIARILVVDDVEMNLKVIVGLLKKTEIQVDTALSGKECLEKTSLNPYDLIFMDHMMPEMDGVETYYAIKKSENPLNKETPVIMLTANAITGVKEKFLQEGFSDYLSKPVNSEKLEAMLIKHLPKEKVILDGAEQAAPAAATETAPATNNAAASADDGAQNENSQDEILESKVENNEHRDMIKKFLKVYPNVDLKSGLSFCGEDSEIYLSAVKSFGESAKIEEIKNHFKEKDTKNYQILVHGVKSSSLGIGLNDLSAKAKALEGAAKENDWNYIEANHDEFIKDFQNAIDATMGVTI